MFVCFMLNAVWVNGLRNCLLLRAHRQDAVRNAQRSEPCSTALELNLAGAVPVKLHRECADNLLLPLELTACSEAEERWGLWMPDLARRSAGQPERLPALCVLQPSASCSPLSAEQEGHLLARQGCAPPAAPSW